MSVDAPDAKRTAVLFLRMVPGAATRGTLFGAAPDEHEIGGLMAAALTIFLEGIRSD